MDNVAGMVVLPLVLALLSGGALASREPSPVATPELPLGLPQELAAAAPEPLELELGRRLFFDPLLSVDRSIACASCHVPERGFADGRARSLGVHGRETTRNAPTILNRALGEAFMWDGRAATLEEQVLLPIENELEMGLPLDDAVARLRADPTYVQGFDASFGEPPSRERLADALATFVRAQVLGGSPVDHFRAGKRDALTAAERSGLWLFESRGGCWRCHSGPNFSDEDFHNTGVGIETGSPDPGRSAVTGDAADTGAFKTPTLRGLALTAPYMHDGSLATLAEVVEFYRKGGHPNPHLDPAMGPIEMTDQDAANLVAFLEALSRTD